MTASASTGDLTVWSDPVCPYCYLASPALDEVGKRLGKRVVYRPFELHPDVPPEGAPKPFPDSAWPRIQAQFTKMSRQVGLPMKPRRDNRNSRLALETQELIRYRYGEEAALKFHRTISAQFFVQHADIADVAMIAGVATSFGVAFDDVSQAWLRRSFQHRVDEATAEALQVGVRGVPSYQVLGSRLGSGLASADAMLEQLIVS